MTSHRVAIAAFAALLCAASLSAQTPQKWQPGRTPDGQPDIQGTWLNFDATPFEAPAAEVRAPAPVAGQAAAPNINKFLTTHSRIFCATTTLHPQRGGHPPPVDVYRD